MEMTTTRALRNAALSVVQAMDNYDCEESVADTLEVLYRPPGGSGGTDREYGGTKMTVHINTLEIENTKRVQALALTPAQTDLMRTDGINPTELMLCVNDRLPGCFPEDMPQEQYPQDFIDQWVIPNWENVKSWVWNDRQLPF